MKRSFLFMLALVVLASGIIALIKERRMESEGSIDSAHEDAVKDRIKMFWEAYNQATGLRSQGEFAKAMALYKRALELNTNHEDSLYYLGNCLFELGDYTEAANVYRRITELSPNSHRGFSQLGVTLSTLAPGAPLDFAQAKKAFERNVQINKEESGPFLRLGLLALNQGNLEEALRHFNTAAGFGSPEGYFLTGYVRFCQRRYREALSCFEKVLEISAREKQITGRGVLSEGDIKATSQNAITPLEAAGIKSLMYLYWTAAKMGGYPDQVRMDFRIKGPKGDTGFHDHGVVDITSRAGVSGQDRGRGAWADYDNDGDLDLAVAAHSAPVRFYRNQGGKLVDIAKSAGLADARNGWDVCWGDYDGDGHKDLYIARSGFIGLGNNSLYRNNGDGTFADVTTRVGLSGKRATARALFCDYNNDGKLDILEVGNAGARQSPLRLFQNEGGKRFRERGREAGIDFQGNVVDCAICDYNGDGLVDLFVLRWKRSAILYRNNRDGSFTDVTSQAKLSGAGGDGFSALFFDYDKDGRLDLLVTSHAPYEMAIRCLIKPDFTAARYTPRLFRNKGDGSFEEVTATSGLNRCYGVMQAIAVDVDKDGRLDLIFANGGLEKHRLEPSVVLHNFEGRQFSAQCYLPGLNAPSNSTGVVAADFDRDSKMDFYLPGSGLYNLRCSVPHIRPGFNR